MASRFYFLRAQYVDAAVVADEHVEDVYGALFDREPDATRLGFAIATQGHLPEGTISEHDC